MNEWIFLFDESEGEMQSSWIRAFIWVNEADEDDKGTLIVRRYEDDPKDIHIHRYEAVPRDIYHQLRDAAESGGSVGSLMNRLVIQNSDIPAADTYTP